MTDDLTKPSLQASLRNLVLDITPGEQLASANAWHGRFNHFGNIVGFTLGEALSSFYGADFHRLLELVSSASDPTCWRWPIPQR